MKKLALIALAAALGLTSAAGFAADTSGAAAKPAMQKKMPHKKHKAHYHKRMHKKAMKPASAAK